MSCNDCVLFFLTDDDRVGIKFISIECWRMVAMKKLPDRIGQPHNLAANKS